MFGKLNFKRSVGRPRLADEKLIKTAKKQIYIVLFFLFIIISVSGLRVMSGLEPAGSYSSDKNNLSSMLLAINSSISINVSGTERRPIGYKANNIVAATSPSTDTVTWTSSNPRAVVFTIGSNPKIISFSVVGTGTSTITARSSSGKTASFTIIGGTTSTSTTTPSTSTVSSRIRINVSGTERRQIGYTANNIVATTTPNSDTVTWTSSNTNVIRIAVSSNPKIISFTVVGAGSSTITARSSSGKTASFTVTGISSAHIVSSTISINVSGTERRQIGYTANYITAATNPSTDTVTWTSSNSNAVRVIPTSNRKVISIKVVGVGASIITARSSSGKTASFTVIGESTITPSTPPATSKYVILNVSGTHTYNKGSTYGPITATTNPSTDTVSWTSSNQNIVKIVVLSNKKINITMVGAGQATITARSSSGKTASFVAVSKSPTTPVTPTNPKATISLSTSGTLTYNKGSTYGPISATTYPSTDTVTWTSSNQGVAKIVVLSNKTINITNVGVGTSTITARSSSGKTASFKAVSKSTTVPVKPTNPKAALSLNVSGTLTYSNGSTYGPITATTNPSTDTVTWTSSNQNAVKIVVLSNKKVNITNVGVGSSTITVKSSSGKTASFVAVSKSTTTPVTPTNPKVTISLSTSGTISYTKGSVVGPITAITNPASNTVTWTSSNSNIIKIVPVSGTKKINIHFVGIGTATITAKSSSGKTASFKAISKITTSVKKPTASIILSASGTEKQKVGYMKNNIKATTNPSTDTVSWTSSNTSIAQIITTSNNKIINCKVVGVGEATITATSSSGKSASFKIIGGKTETKPVTSSISLSTSGTTTYAKGAVAGPIIATTSPSSDTVTWTSSNPNIVKVIVLSNKKINASFVGVGTATIIAKSSSGKTASFKVISKSASNPITPPKIDPKAKLSLSASGTDKQKVGYIKNSVTATTTPSTDTVSWTSSNTKVVQIITTNNNKIINCKVVGIGEATITAKSSSGKTASFKIKGEDPAPSANGTISLTVSGTITRDINYEPLFYISAFTTPFSDTVTWTSSNTKVVQINVKNGSPKMMKYKVVGAGEAIITARSSSGKTASFKIIGLGNPTPASTVSLNVPSTTKFAKGTVAGPIVATTNPSTEIVKWTSSNSNIIKIVPSSNPKQINIKFVGVGKATITATISNGIKASIEATSIEVPKEVASITINTSGTIKKDIGYTSSNIVATTKPGSDKVTWTSSNTGVAQIIKSNDSKKIQYKVVGSGLSTITATSSSGKTASFKVSGQTVKTMPSTVTLDAKSPVKHEQGSIVGPITATTSPSTNTVKWTSSNTGVAKIDVLSNPKQINIKFVGVGKATITAKTSGGAKASFEVQSTNKLPSLEQSTIKLDYAGTEELKVNTVFGPITATTDPADEQVVWTSSNTKVAVIVQTTNPKQKKIRVVGIGTATILAITKDGSQAGFVIKGIKNIVPSKISINKPETPIFDVGKKVGPFIATTTPSSDTVKWTSSNINVAAIIPTKDPKQIYIVVVGPGKSSIMATTSTESADGFVLVGNSSLSAPSGSWFWPTTTVGQYVTSTFTSSHGAVDMTCHGCLGKPVYAAGAGVVIRSGSTESSGFDLIIDHQNGYKTEYYHLLSGSRIVKVGDTVKAGQQIASVGNTGLESFGPHLHFVITKRISNKDVKLNACSDAVFGKCYKYCKNIDGRMINSGC